MPKGFRGIACVLLLVQLKYDVIFLLLFLLEAHILSTLKYLFYLVNAMPPELSIEYVSIQLVKTLKGDTDSLLFSNNPIPDFLSVSSMILQERAP